MTFIRAAGRRDRDTAALAATGNWGVKNAGTRTLAHRTMNRGIDYALRTAVVIGGAVAMINVHEAARSERQEDNRWRFWAPIAEVEGRYLRVVTLEDRPTIHNAFLDPGFTP